MMEKFKARLRGAWHSTTIRFNILMGALYVLLPQAQDAAPALQPYIPAELYQWMMGAIVAGNIALRFKTALDLADRVRK